MAVRRRRAGRFRRILTALSVLVLLGGTAYFAAQRLKEDRLAAQNEQIRSTFYAATEAPVPSATPEMFYPETPLISPEPSAEAEMPAHTKGPYDYIFNFPELPSVVDKLKQEGPAEGGFQPQFAELYEVNGDLIGWIRMADCVDYPLLWRDNVFYMDHDFFGNPSQAGAIFLDERSAPDLSDGAMLIYGHNMRAGTMFGELDRYREMDYLVRYPTLELQSAWESKPRTYVLISLFDASMNRDDPSYINIVRMSFADDAEKEVYLEELRNRSMYDIPIDADAGDQLVTLVTCSYSHKNGRFLLVARQLREGETVEDICEKMNALRAQ